MKSKTGDFYRLVCNLERFSLGFRFNTISRAVKSVKWLFRGRVASS